MLGTVVNAAAVIAGCLVGLLFKGGVPDKYNKTIMHAVSLAVLVIGIKGALGSDALLVVIFSLALGSFIGEAMRIEDGLEYLGRSLEKRFSGKEKGTGDDGKFYQGFVTATLIFCVGSMAIVGSLESGLAGNHQTLFAKSALDGITSIILGSSFGIGVLFSSLPIFLYQGSITMAAVFIKPFLVPEVVSQMSSVGGVLIMAIGINLLGAAKIRIGSMLPAIFLPMAWYLINLLF
ncbi:DUF554 domain-containing protein [Desulfamplus magnetovallimortis]|uniref:DUF554 domain-containing protein n=1 Tax=Desulfamplus magnetovallimortis TaxID=1246637 RepID=UPI0009BA98CA|nr:DUF554 domain-containing protein [Desulfamplus magnetovallimortis]